MNEQQKRAVTFGDGPLLIVAGAGTGKTTVVTQRIAWLILEKKIPTDDVLALTFTEKAAAEMEERIDVLMPYGYVDLWVSTFHGFCERVLKDNALEIGLPPDFKLLNTTAQALLVHKNFDKFDLDYYRPLGNPTKFVQALIKHFTRAKDESVLPEDYLKYADTLKLDRDQQEFIKKRGTEDREVSEAQRIAEIANAYHTYQQLLLDNSALDFGDLILYTIRLFKERPRVLKKYQEQFKYVLVDEFQDTNYAQYELVKLLSAPKNNLTVVGDDDQSIYKFRGAAISNILEFKKDFPDSQEIVLTENYRTKQNILDMSYKFIKQNDPNRLEYQLSKGKVDKKGAPLKTKVSKQLKSTRGDNGVIEYLQFNSYLEEASGVVKKILELKKKDKKLAWSDFAVLIRANSYAQDFIAALSRYDIPHQFLASSGLYSMPEIMDVVAYLKLLDNYHENSAMWRVLNFPHWQLPVKDLMTLSRYANQKSLSLYETLQKTRSISGLSDGLHQHLEKVLGYVHEHTQIARDRGVLPAALHFMRDTGYLKSLTEHESADNLEKIVHLNQFFREIEAFEGTHEDKSVQNFLSELEQAQEAGDEGSLAKPWEEGPEAVKIMTVHGAKGLEFPYVFIVNLVDKRFPSIERKEPIELPDALIKEIIPEGDIHLQEERRLFYVAMTRARDGLHFTSAEDYGGTRRKKASRFLVELGFVDKQEKPALDLVEHLQPAQISQKEIDDLTFLRQAIPEKASYTQLKAFETCPKQFKYAHILRLPVEGRHTFSFGKSIHNTLYQFFKQIKEVAGTTQGDLFGAQKEKKFIPTLKDLLKIYDAEWLDDWYLSKQHKDEYYEKGKKLLTTFFEQNDGKWPTPLYLEQQFNLKLGEHTFKGVIDRVDSALPEANGTSQSASSALHVARKNSDVASQELQAAGQKVELIDYKTGQMPKGGKLGPDEKEQLLIYDLAAREVMKLKPVQLSYYYLEANKKLSFSADESEAQKMKENLIAKIKAIRSSDFQPTPGFWCQSCDFRDICEDRWRG